MSKHVTYRGVTLDMESIRRENEKVPAIGNMSVNARGDQIKGGKITKTADQIARENHRIQSAVVSTSLKGPIEKSAGVSMDKVQKKPVKATTKPVKTKEVEQENGDIVIEDDNDAGK